MQDVLAGMYGKGQGVNKDIEKAVRWHREAAAQGYESAKIRLNNLGGTYRGSGRIGGRATQFFSFLFWSKHKLLL